MRSIARAAWPRRAPLLLLAALLLLPSPLGAQKHPVTDRALSTSLMAAATPFPSSPHRMWGDTLTAPGRVRLELGYSRIVLGEIPLPLLVLGVRTDFLYSDSAGLSGGLTGLRVAFPTTRGTRDGGLPAAVEVHAGFRTLSHLDRPALPDVGLDFVAGWSNLAENTNGAFGIRAPVEWVRPNPRGRLTLGIAPTIAWGHIRFRGCEDTGPGDNCGDLGIQLEFGRTRFLLAGGMSLGLAPSGLSLSLGTQQLLAAGQDPRLALALAWTP
jgi:hypothetical protein